MLPHQGYRSDFWYDYKKHTPAHLFMIWPEFEDDEGNVITEDDKPVPASGTARMWIIGASIREYHKNKIQEGLKGYFMEGARRVAECEVVELLGLPTNPTS